MPTASPFTALTRTFSAVPAATSTVTPDSVARRAACTFVAIPPIPLTVPAPDASATISSEITRTSAINVAVECRRGSAVNNPSWSVSRTSRSASIRLATSAERLSLSPILISSVATTSFSLMMGTTFLSSSASSVLRAFR